MSVDASLTEGELVSKLRKMVGYLSHARTYQELEKAKGEANNLANLSKLGGHDKLMCAWLDLRDSISSSMLRMTH